MFYLTNRILMLILIFAQLAKPQAANLTPMHSLKMSVPPVMMTQVLMISNAHPHDLNSEAAWKKWVQVITYQIRHRNNFFEELRPALNNLEKTPGQRILEFANRLNQFNAVLVHLKGTRDAQGLKPGGGYDVGVPDPRLVHDIALGLDQGHLDASEVSMTRYARIILDEWIVQHLVLLSLRIWDDESHHAPSRYKKVQALLDELQDGPMSSGQHFVHDAAYLVFLATALFVDYYGESALHRLMEAIRTHPNPRQRLLLQIAAAMSNVVHLQSQQFNEMKNKTPIHEAQYVVAFRNDIDYEIILSAYQGLLEAKRQSTSRLTPRQKAQWREALFAIQRVHPDFFAVAGNDHLLAPFLLKMGKERARIFVERLAASQTFLLKHPQWLEEVHQRLKPLAGHYAPTGISSVWLKDLVLTVTMLSVQEPEWSGWAFDDAFWRSADPAQRRWAQSWEKVHSITRVDRIITGSRRPNEYLEEKGMELYEWVFHKLQRARLLPSQSDPSVDVLAAA